MKALVLKRIVNTLEDKFNSLRSSKLLYGQKGRYFTNAYIFTWSRRPM